MVVARDMIAAEPLLDAEDSAFVEGGVSVVVAARDGDNVPTLIRGLGCRVSADRRRVTAFVPASQAAALLDDVRANGSLAVVLSQPSTHRTLQLKGADAKIVPLVDGDRECLSAYPGRFAAELAMIGFPAPFSNAMTSARQDDVVAIAFSPAEAFTQTPGPDAGNRLKGRT